MNTKDFKTYLEKSPEQPVDLDAEEAVAQIEIEAEMDEDEQVADDPDDEVDPMGDMTKPERKVFAREVRPVMLVMAKVSRFHR